MESGCSSSSWAECGVCLGLYDGVSIVPRVIPCGHSVCEECILLIPQPFPNTIRCPFCNQLVNLPKHPSHLPKNIDLLRFSSDKPNTPITTLNHHHHDLFSFIPQLWTPQFFHHWITWLLPADILHLVSPSPHHHTQTGIILNTEQTNSITIRNSLFGGILPQNHKVLLLELGFLSHLNQQNTLKYNSQAILLNFLYVMDYRKRDELILLLNSTLRLHRIGKLYGFWANQDSVYMVCESFTSCLLDKLLCFQPGIGSKQLLASLIIMGVEMCEIVYGLHLDGLLVGCFTGFCFGFDDFGRAFFDVGSAINAGRRVRRVVSDFISDKVGRGGDDLSFREFVLEYGVFASPELLAKMMGKKGVVELETSEFEVCCGSDVWCLACLLLWLLIGKSFAEEMYNYYSLILFHESTEGEEGWLDLYMGWMKEVTALLDRRLDTEFDLLKKVLCKCLDFHPVNRPSLNELWRCMKEPLIESEIDVMKSLRLGVTRESIKCCIVLGELCRFDKEIENCTTQDVSEGNDDGIRSVEHEGNSITDKDIGEGVDKGKIKCIDLKGHIDSITALTVGGGFLFSSSYDRIVNVWSLQDFTHVLSLKGHEHRVMAVVYVDETSLCIGGDSGGVICIWNARVPLDIEPIKKLHEHKDWRYSGIHAMAVSGTQCLYTGSGDKTIKAWGLQDYTVICVMSGHKSVVSCLAVNSGVLYSGSWDGTVRLWCISDHSPLAVIGEDTPSNISPVLALAAEHSFLFVTHEDGLVKIWQNDRLFITKKVHNGAVFAVLKNGRWLFAGGWDKTISVQELSGDGAESDISLVGYMPSESAITALAYWQGKLCVGQADKIIKVYYSIL